MQEPCNSISYKLYILHQKCNIVDVHYVGNNKHPTHSNSMRKMNHTVATFLNSNDIKHLRNMQEKRETYNSSGLQQLDTEKKLYVLHSVHYVLQLSSTLLLEYHTHHSPSGCLLCLPSYYHTCQNNTTDIANYSEKIFMNNNNNNNTVSIIEMYCHLRPPDAMTFPT